MNINPFTEAANRRIDGWKPVDIARRLLSNHEYDAERVADALTSPPLSIPESIDVARAGTEVLKSHWRSEKIHPFLCALRCRIDPTDVADMYSGDAAAAALRDLGFPFEVALDAMTEGRPLAADGTALRTVAAVYESSPEKIAAALEYARAEEDVPHDTVGSALRRAYPDATADDLARALYSASGAGYDLVGVAFALHDGAGFDEDASRAALRHIVTIGVSPVPTAENYACALALGLGLDKDAAIRETIEWVVEPRLREAIDGCE